MKETRNLPTGMCYSLNPEFNVRLTMEVRHNSVFLGGVLVVVVLFLFCWVGFLFVCSFQFLVLFCNKQILLILNFNFGTTWLN